jgi:hypothetical protein
LIALGSLLGGLATYRLARTGGEEALARRVSKHDSEQRFRSAMTQGSAVRFTALALLAELYGRGILTFVTRHEHPALMALIVWIVLAGIACG